MANPITIPEIVNRWQSGERPLFRGRLIDDDGCKCAQGDVLSCAGYSDKQLRAMAQDKADSEVARILGISRAHAVLLRNINDKHDGCPQDVLIAPEKIIGDKARLVLKFWRYLDGMSKEQWKKVVAEWDAAWAAAWDAARDAAWDAADAAWAAAWDAARDAAWVVARATNEIQGMDILRSQGKPFYFLNMFGIEKPEDLEGIDG